MKRKHGRANIPIFVQGQSKVKKVSGVREK
jgi:hypothetical protein